MSRLYREVFGLVRHEISNLRKVLEDVYKGCVIFSSGYPVGAFFAGTAIFFRPLIFFEQNFRPLKFLTFFFTPLKVLALHLQIFRPLISQTKNISDPLYFKKRKFQTFLLLVKTEYLFPCFGFHGPVSKTIKSQMIRDQ